MDKINVIHHMNEFRNILSYATNTGGFFFGAGTSCVFGLPTIGKLTRYSKMPTADAYLKRWSIKRNFEKWLKYVDFSMI